MIFIDCCILESLCKYSNNLIFSVERVGWKGICQIVVTFKFPECSGLSRRVYAPAVGWNLITLLFDSRTLYRVLQNPDDIHSEEERRNLRISISICIIKLSVEFEIFTAGPRSPNIYTQAHVVRARGGGRCLLFIHCTFDSIHRDQRRMFSFLSIRASGNICGF